MQNWRDNCSRRIIEIWQIPIFYIIMGSTMPHIPLRKAFGFIDGASSTKSKEKHIEKVKELIQKYTPKSKWSQKFRTLAKRGIEGIQFLPELLRILGLVKKAKYDIAFYVLNYFLEIVKKKLEKEAKHEKSSTLSKQQLSREMSEFFLCHIKAHYNAAAGYITDSKLEDAQKELNFALNLMDVYWSEGKIHKFASSMGSQRGLKMMFLLYQMLGTSGNAYLQVYRGEYKEREEKRVSDMFIKIRNIIIGYRMGMITLIVDTKEYSIRKEDSGFNKIMTFFENDTIVDSFHNVVKASTILQIQEENDSEIYFNSSNELGRSRRQFTRIELKDSLDGYIYTTDSISNPAELELIKNAACNYIKETEELCLQKFLQI